MSTTIEKVTAFITRPSADGHDLLLFRHPYAGIQIPGGTVQPGESPEGAAAREAAEETGLEEVSIHCYLGSHEDQLPEGERIVFRTTRVYARPDPTSFDWAYLPQGATVQLTGRAGAGFSQVTWVEYDRVPDPQYVSMRITGWVPGDALTEVWRRHFYHLTCHCSPEEEWIVHADHHRFALFWAPLDALPEIIYPQDEWLAYLNQEPTLRQASVDGRERKDNP
jgi:8-oxo-dGTP pyrophosphatase MutT (NUDIX family)